MKRAWIILFLMVSPLWADSLQGDDKTRNELRQNVYGFRDFLMRNIRFPKADPGRRIASTRGSSKVCPFNSSQYNQAAKSDWVKDQLMNGLTTLSEQLSKTVGTAFAPQAARQLQSYAVQLQGSGDPQFGQIGTLYQQEAQAIASGNVTASGQIASEVAALPRPEVAPGYQPSQQESAFVSAFNQVIGTAIAALGGVLGSLVVSEILTSLGITNLGALMGIGQSMGSSLASGANPSQTLNYAGASAVQTGGSAVIQQLGTVNLQPRQSQTSANSGGAPPAQ